MENDIAKPDEDTLARMLELVRDGSFLSAWQLAEPLAPLQTWTGCTGRNVAARLADALGSRRLGTVLHWLNARQFPADPDAFLAGLLRRFSARGPMAVLPLAEARLAADTLQPGERADLLGACAAMQGQLHDFDQAHRLLGEALEAAPESAWLLVQKSAILEAEDRYAEALEAAREAGQRRSHGVAAILQMADCLIHLRRDDEAEALLRAAHERGESGAYAAQLVNLYSEREDHGQALHYLDEHDRCHPLLDQPGRDWSHRRRADMLYLAGDFAECLKYCDLVSDGFHQKMAANLRQPDALLKKRRRLPVPFVRQHSMTCAPATIAALAEFGGRRFDHLEIAAAICDDGTPWHKERGWAEAHGFIATEFRLTPGILVQLIDRGVPFTLTTEAVTSAHLQACIGYDDRVGTVLLRDPTERHYGEIMLAALLQDHPVQGPRCMLVLAENERAKIADLLLPDAEVYSANHRVSVALDEHDRPAACAALAAMPAEHPMTRWAEFRLASYDRNPAAESRAIEALTARFPEHAPSRFARLGVLQRLRDTARQRELLQAELAREHCDPVFYSELGELLAKDARQLSLADYYLRKAVRWRRGTARVHASLGWCRWKERRFEEAGRYRRAASCLAPTFEPYAAASAELCRLVGQPAEGLAFLRRRVERAGHKNAGPWLTLAGELNAQNQMPEGAKVLERALAALPADGNLLLAAGRLLAGWGRREEGEKLMAAARGKVREAEWQREMAGHCAFQGRRAEALAHWRALLSLEPSSIDAWRAMARLLAEDGGTEQAITFLQEATGQQAQNPELWGLLAEWQASLGPQAAIPALEKALALEPNFTWVLRELALQHLRAGAGEAALALARDAVRREPHLPGSHGVLGSVLEDLSRPDEARQSYQAAIALDVDYDFASRGLLRIAPDLAAKVDALQFLRKEMLRQVSDGSIVSEYREMASPYLEQETLLGELRQFCEERPDLWQTWAARRQQALDLERVEEAFLCARELIERFPLLPRAWVEMARAHRAVGDSAREIEMLGKAVHLSPAWGLPAHQLSEALERMERYEEAEAVLERNLQHDPLDGPSHGYLAGLLWKRGRRTEAFDRLLRGMRDCPAYHWGWNTLAAWSGELQRAGEVVAAMERHSASRAHLAAWWIIRADVLADLDRLPEALEVTEAGLQRHPAELDLFEKKAWCLASLARFDDALATCAAGLQMSPGSRTLRGRQAFVLMQSGQPKEAIRQMNALVLEHPDYLWAIRQLADWLSGRGQWEELRDLAQRWVRQTPQSALPYGFLAQAEKSLSHRAAAQSALSKAFSLDPEYRYAGRSLLSYQIEDRDFEAAGRTLRTLQHHAFSAEVAADAVELAIGQKDRPQAREHARETLLRPDVTTSLLAWLAELFEKAGWRRDWLKLLDQEALHAALPSAPVLQTWLRSQAARGKLKKAAARLGKLPADAQDLAASGWIALFDSAGQKKHSRTVRKWIARQAGWFRSRTDLWAAAGNALINLHDYPEAARWFHDWEKRAEEAPCDALFNCGVAFHDVSGWRQAIRVREVALRRFPNHVLANALRAIVALQTALTAGPEAAQKLAAEVEPEKLTHYYSCHFALYRSLAAANAGDFSLARQQYQAARKYFHPRSRDRGLASLFKDVHLRLATLLPWAKGRAWMIHLRWGAFVTGDKDKWVIAAIVLVFLIRYLLDRFGN